jgi:hypothetical protein
VLTTIHIVAKDDVYERVKDFSAGDGSFRDRPFALISTKADNGYRAKMWNVCVLDDAAKYWFASFPARTFQWTVQEMLQNRESWKDEIAKTQCQD